MHILYIDTHTWSNVSMIIMATLMSCYIQILMFRVKPLKCAIIIIGSRSSANISNFNLETHSMVYSGMVYAEEPR